MTIVLGLGMSGAILGVMRLFMPLRVSVADEIRGSDLSEHGEEAYYGEDINALAGRAISLGDSVLIPATDIGRASSSTPTKPLSSISS